MRALLAAAAFASNSPAAGYKRRFEFRETRLARLVNRIFGRKLFITVHALFAARGRNSFTTSDNTTPAALTDCVKAHTRVAPFMEVPKNCGHTLAAILAPNANLHATAGVFFIRSRKYFKLLF